MRLQIPDVPPSLNKVLRMHWATKRRLNEYWISLIHSCREARTEQGYKVKRSVKVTLHHSRLYDKDNAYGACKTLVDGLVKLNLLFDDTAEWLNLTVEQAKCPHKQRHTVIEIEASA